jgi:ketosteroid isomerase-like protein
VGRDNRAVSRSNLEIVRAIVDAANRGAYDEIDWFHDPEVVLHQSGTFDPTSYVGREQIRAFVREVVDTFEGHISVEIEEEFERDDRVLVCLLFHWQARGSDAEGVSRRWWSYRFRDGLVTDIEIHVNRDEAMTAVGIRPDWRPGQPGVAVGRFGPPLVAVFAATARTAALPPTRTPSVAMIDQQH